MIRKDNVYDPYWQYVDLEEERLRNLREVRKHAINTVGPEGDGKHEEAIQVQEKSQAGVLFLDQQKESRIPKVARVKKPKSKRKVKGKWSFSDDERQRRSKVMKDRWKKKREDI